MELRKDFLQNTEEQDQLHDDVEGIFAFLRGLLGPIFDEKAFHDVFPKVISEYTKKCDPDLPFYYYTGSNDCFNDG